MSTFRANRPVVADVDRCRRLRRRATDAEERLWRLLRDRRMLGEKFRRQHEFGPYVLDFFCVERRLVVEADGGQHYLPDGLAHDRGRDRFLERHGIAVLRFSNREILCSPEAVREEIARVLAARASGERDEE